MQGLVIVGSRDRRQMTMPRIGAATTALLILATAARAAETLPDAIQAPGETAVVTLHAEGAQVYECKASSDGKLAWAFREPIATLFEDGKTVGRPYAGPELGRAGRRAGTGQAV